MAYPIQQLPLGYLNEKAAEITNAIARIETHATNGRADFVLAELIQLRHYAEAIVTEAGRLREDAKVAT